MVWTSSLMVFIGVAVRFFAPGDDVRQSDELTGWLLSFAAETHSEAASAKLNEIKLGTGDDYKTILAKASEIMVEYPDLFSITSESDPANDQELFEILLIQWNLSNQATGMSKGLKPDRSRTVATTPHDYQSRHWAGKTFDAVKAPVQRISNAFPVLESFISTVLLPLIGGKAINAP